MAPPGRASSVPATASSWTFSLSASASWSGARKPAAAFSLVEHPIPPRTLVAPLHIHEREDEYSYVLEGRMGAQLGDDVVYAEAGDLVFKPRNQWHTFWNAGDTTCRLLEIISPAGFEHFFNELGEQMAEAKAVSVASVPDLAGLGARYGHYFQPDSIARLCQQHGLVYPG